MSPKEVAQVYAYAHRFVDRVGHQEDIWSVYDDIAGLVTIMENSKIARFFNDVTVSTEDKEAFARTLRQSDYRVVNDLIENVLREEQADLLLPVLQEVLVQINSHKNEFDATIVSVQPLTDKQKERLCRLMEQRFHLKVRQVIEEIDKDLLGGFVITVNNRVIDASVRSQLQDIRSKL